MEKGFLRNWPILMIAAVMGLSFYAMSLVLRTPEIKDNPENLSYEMIRPKAADVEYDLSARIVVKDIKDFKRTNSAPAGKAESQTVAKKGEAKKPDPKKKDEKNKKAQTNKKKPELTVQIQSDSAAKMKGFDSNNASNERQAPAYSLPIDAAVAGAGADVPGTETDDKVKLSAAQWRTLLFAQPTAKNGNDFVTAYKDGDVDVNSFYKIAEELLTDSAADRQKLALYVLKQDATLRTFTLLVSHYRENTPEALRTQIYEVLKTYGTVGNFPALSRALNSSDMRVVEIAVQILTQTVASQNSQQTQSGRGEIRGPGSMPIPPEQFKIFLPILQKLVSSQNSQIAQLAQALLDSIQTLKVA